MDYDGLRPESDVEKLQQFYEKASMDENDNEERYRQHLAFLIGRTKSRGGTKYFNQFVNKCRAEAAVAYPKGAAAARKKDIAGAGFFGVLASIFSFLG